MLDLVTLRDQLLQGLQELAGLFDTLLQERVHDALVHPVQLAVLDQSDIGLLGAILQNHLLREISEKHRYL